jgi:hypothetical protein
MIVAAALMLAGCGAGHTASAQTAALSYYRALGTGHTGAACAELAPATVHAIATTVSEHSDAIGLDDLAARARRPSQSADACPALLVAIMRAGQVDVGDMGDLRAVTAAHVTTTGHVAHVTLSAVPASIASLLPAPILPSAVTVTHGAAGWRITSLQG